MNARVRESVEYWIPYAMGISKKYKQRWPQRFHDDIDSAAMWGLTKALWEFDESRGVPLKTYIGMVVSRSIADDLRSIAGRRNWKTFPLVADLPIMHDDCGNVQEEFYHPEYRHDWSMPEYDFENTMDFINVYRSEDRQLFRDFWLHGKSQKEIGEKHGVNQTAISARIKNAVARVRKANRVTIKGQTV